MRVTVYIQRAARDERGAVLVTVALWLPLLVVFCTFAIDVGNWFVHRDHLQMQADAAALAAAQEYRFPCSDSAITTMAGTYGGDTYNAQIGGTPASRVHRLINSKTFYNQPTPSDDTTPSPPCSAGMIDVKLTETDLPWLFPPVGWLAGKVTPNVKYVNAQARVSITQLDSANGALPVGVPDVNPRAAKVFFVDESNGGAVLGSTTLDKIGPSGALTIWDNAAHPVPVKFDTNTTDVGVVIALGGTPTSTTCGQPLVTCYDATAPTSGGIPTKGIVHIQGYSNAGSGAQPNAPLVRGVSLLNGSCSDPYFSSATSSCTIGVRAKVDFGTVAGVDQTNVVGGQVTATVGGTQYTLTYDSTNKVWNSPLTIPVAPGAGAVPITLGWAETKGTQAGNACKTGGGNKCTGSFGTVQRAFSASSTASGPIQLAQVFENGVQWTNSFERCSTVQTSCTHNLVVRIGVTGNLANAASVNDPVVALRVVGGSQNQSLDCDPNISQLKDEIAQGCSPFYARNTGTACPGSPSALWSTAQPWQCVAVQTGSATNQVPAGMNTRILGTDKPASCTAPNHWSQFPNISRSDPRLIQVLLTPFGTFSGSGSTTVPVSDFATFYVTGWTGQGQGFNNPCQGQGDDPVPNNDAGYIVGHFIKYVATISSGTGSQPCAVNAFGTCVAVLSR